jgi:2-furoate---CoA ligase
MNVGQVFRRTTDRVPETEGLVDPAAETRYTYRTWYERSRSVAAGLEAQGIGAGDRIATAMRNRVELLTLYGATQLLGAVFVPYNFRLSSEEITYRVDISRPDVVVHASETGDVVRSGTDEAELEPLLVAVDDDSDALAFDALVAAGDSDTFTPTVVDADQTSVILHTSGTTGQPKSVPRTHENTYAAAMAHIFHNSWSEGETTLGLMPLSHTMGLHGLVAIVLLGGTWVNQREFSAASTADLIETEGISSLYFIPTVYHDLVGADVVEDADLSSVRHISYAGASMSPALIRDIDALIDPETIVNHYGSTEQYTHTTCDWVREKPNCVGRAGINTSVRVVEPSDFGHLDPDEVVESGELGEIIVDVTSPEGFHGYLTETDDRSIVDNWFFTGDLGHYDRDGDLNFVGRIDNMIISGGENIYPVEVESVLELHDVVSEAAIVGRASERWNQTVVAFLTLSTDPSEVDFETAAVALDEHCLRSEELADFKRPRKYYFIDEFTKTNVGKILRKELEKEDIDVDVHAVIDI